MKMKLYPKSLTMALLCSAALVPAAYAQDQNQAAGQGACAELTQLTEEHQDRLQDEWLEQADAAVTQDNSEQCATYVQQAENALNQNESAEEGGEAARIVVEQPRPNVAIQQAAPDISVRQPQPQVSVNQGQPEIIVRQAQPTITVDMPQPTITIDQPEPEIIVRMPEPAVSVSTPQPEVEVSQEQPQVSVSQAEPTIEVQEQEQAEVSVEREQAVVQQQAAEGEPQVNVERGQPVVSYERAEPNIQFNSQGEPEVQFTQSGEPQVRFEDGAQASAGGEQDANERQARAASAQNAQDTAGQSDAISGEQDANERQARAASAEDAQDTGGQSAVTGEQTASVSPQQAASAEERAAVLRGDGGQTPSGEAIPVDVSSLLGKQVVNGQDQELGTVERVVTDGDRNYAVLSQGGFLGIGQDEVGLPLDRMAVSSEDDRLVMRGMTEEEINQMPEFRERNVQDVRQDAQIDMNSL